MGNCVDSGDSNAGADGKGAAGLAGAVASGAEYTAKSDAGRVVVNFLADKKFTISEFEGEGEEAKTAWSGPITEADGAFTLDASAEGATTSDVKTFTATLLENGSLSLGHKFIGDLEEFAPKGEAAAAADAPAEEPAAAAE